MRLILLSLQIVKVRRDQAIHLLPPLKIRYEVYEPSQNIPETALLSQDSIYAILKQEGFEPTAVKSAAYTFPRHSWVDAHMQSSSATDLNSISLDVESGSSTPDGTKVCSSTNDVTNNYSKPSCKKKTMLRVERSWILF